MTPGHDVHMSLGDQHIVFVGELTEISVFIVTHTNDPDDGSVRVPVVEEGGEDECAIEVGVHPLECERLARGIVRGQSRTVVCAWYRYEWSARYYLHRRRGLDRLRRRHGGCGVYDRACGDEPPVDAEGEDEVEEEGEQKQSQSELTYLEAPADTHCGCRSSDAGSEQCSRVRLTCVARTYVWVWRTLAPATEHNAL